jgi:hypothetical protein
MPSLIERREELTRMRIVLKELFLIDRKEYLFKKITNLLRDKLFNKINASEILFLLQRVDVLLSTLIVKRQVSLTLKKINHRLKKIERNTKKIISTLSTYASVAKTKSTRNVDVTTITIASYNNINQQRQLRKTKRKRRMIFKIRKQKKRRFSECYSSKS